MQALRLLSTFSIVLFSGSTSASDKIVEELTLRDKTPRLSKYVARVARLALYISWYYHGSLLNTGRLNDWLNLTSFILKWY